jgi:urea transport system ATP-binding protein
MTNPGFIGHGPESSAMLYLDGVTVSFDGFRALDNLSLLLEPGELRAVIGPNGAGKSTMMDVITGRVRPDTGDVLFKGGIDLTRHDEAYIANLGIGRKFQTPTVFENQTVYHNLEIAMQAPRGVWPNLWHRPGPRDTERIDETLETIGLTAQRQTIAGTLAHGQKQWLEIGMLMVRDLELLLVDEPVAGMTDAETERTAELLRGIAGERSVVVVEHDMPFVASLGCKVTVLHGGAVLAEGSHEAVQRNEQVIAVYLGR